MSEHLSAFLALPPSQIRVPRPRAAKGCTARTAETKGVPEAPKAASDQQLPTQNGGATAVLQETKTVPKDHELRNMLEQQKATNPNVSFGNLLKNIKTQRPSWEFSTKRAKRILRTQVQSEDGGKQRSRSGSREPRPENITKSQTTHRTAPSGPLFVGRIAGSRPNLFWRAVMNSDLREHPLYKSLPEPWEVKVESAADLALFQQDSEQWDLLHDGRLTTSRCAPVLGIYEPLAAKTLGVPAALSGHGKALDAFQRLLRPPCDPHSLSSLSSPPSSSRPPRKSVWREDSQGPFPYAYEPRPEAGTVGRSYTVESVGRARMVWGSTQEPTSILAAVNHFASEGAEVREVGMCPLEAHTLPPALLHAPDGSLLDLPLIGASPDGAVHWPDGSVEAVEVKNHAPFREGGSTRKSKHRSKFYLHDPGPWATVAPWHVIQIQLEILCLGPQCRAANFMSCSATRGINVLRVPRDDAYIARMLHLIHVFQQKYVRANVPPPPNFAAEFPDYLPFLEATKRVAATAKLVTVIPPQRVQRSPLNRHFFLDK